jgi:DNA-binding NtrC family response regulator
MQPSAKIFARLAAFRFELPPLRDRMEDLGVILASMCGSAATASTAPLRFDTDAAFALITHPWRRNVRELIHAIEVARMLARDGVVRVADLPLGASVPAPLLEGSARRRHRRSPRRMRRPRRACSSLHRAWRQRRAIARDMGRDSKCSAEEAFRPASSRRSW